MPVALPEAAYESKRPNCRAADCRLSALFKITL